MTAEKASAFGRKAFSVGVNFSYRTHTLPGENSLLSLPLRSQRISQKWIKSTGHPGE